MQKIRKLLSLLLAILMLIAALPMRADAAPKVEKQTLVLPYFDLHDRENSDPASPFSEALIVRFPALFSAPSSTIEIFQGESYECSFATAAQELRAGLVAHSAGIGINVKVPAYDHIPESDFDRAAKELFDLAIEHTGNPAEGDYLRWSMGGYEAPVSCYNMGDYYYATLTYRPTYYTTAEQEAQVSAAIAAAIDSFGFTPYTSDYCKVKTVYEYIMDRCSYDNEHLNDDSYKLKHSAYAALIKKTAVCQGYALLLYRMLLECGVDCRLISGDAGGPHAWNIVELDGKWYNVDVTWDDGRPQLPYFLNNTTFDSSHLRDNEYNTVAFHEAYPMAESDYIPDESRDFDLDLATADLTLLLRHVAQISAIDDPEVLARVDLDNSDSLDAADITALATAIAAHSPEAA